MKLRRYDLFTRLLRARPLMLSALLYLTGCILGHALSPRVLICASAMVVLPAGGLLLRKSHKRTAAAMLVLLFLPLGALNFHLHWNAAAPFEEQKEAFLSGRICEIPQWNADTQRTICVLENLRIGQTEHSGKIRLYLRGDADLLQAVQLGQNISCTAHIWQGDRAANPGEFDFDRYLRLEGLRGYATAQIENAALSVPEYKFGDWPERIRLKLSDRIDRLFPRNGALAQAFLLGDRSGLSQEERQSYNISGAGHLLAISGMHVSVLAGFTALLLGRIIGRRGAYCLTLMLLLIYGSLIGFSASLVRAIIMFAVYNLAPIIGRHSDAPTRLAAAMLLYLLIRPIAILEAGFILSYGASGGIIFLSAPLSRLMHIDRFLGSKPRNGFAALFTDRLPKWIAQSVLYSLSAQLATLPAVIHFFGAQPLWSVIANLPAIPLAMIAYISAIAAAIIGFAPIAAIPDYLFGLLTDCVAFFGGLPMAALKIARFPLWLSLICALACFLASDLSRIHEKIRRFLPLTVIAAVFVSNFCAMMTTLGCSIVFLDAGEADCAVIRTQGKVYMVDTGDSYSPAADYLSALNYDIDGLFLSHCHTDHAGGLAGILDVCTPRRIYISANWDQFEIDDSVSNSLQTAADRGSEIIFLSAGDTLSLSGKTLLEVLSPAAGFWADSANDDSLVLRISHGDCSAVFTGDAGADTLEACMRDTDILKAAHHGALDGTSAQLLLQASPSVAVIPVGYNNYGHPANRTLELLDAAGAHIYRTDAHGAITCRLNADGSVNVHTYQTSEEADGLE